MKLFPRVEKLSRRDIISEHFRYIQKFYLVNYRNQIFINVQAVNMCMLKHTLKSPCKQVS